VVAAVVLPRKIPIRGDMVRRVVLAAVEGTLGETQGLQLP